MKWYAISGSWSITTPQVQENVEEVVREIISNGDGIVTGGALGVDYVATQIVLNEGNPKKQLQLYLPIPLDAFCNHYNVRAGQEVITQEQADIITSQLQRAKDLGAVIFDNFGFTHANEESYYARNTKIIEAGDCLYAFQVNKSKGTQDAINKARSLGREVIVKEYEVPKKANN